MRELSAIELIELWSSDEAVPAQWRLEPLVTASAENNDITDDTLGQRNQRLLELYQLLTDRPMAARSRCTTCATENEFPVPVSAILACRTPAPNMLIAVRSHRKRLRFRIPTMRDLRLAVGLPSGCATAKLASVCLVRGKAADVTEMAIARLDERLEVEDPAARILLNLICAECSGAMRVLVDVAEIAAATVDGLIEKALREVHVLAAAYGWSERAILELPESRRRRYLALVAANSAYSAPARAVRA